MGVMDRMGVIECDTHSSYKKGRKIETHDNKLCLCMIAPIHTLCDRIL